MRASAAWARPGGSGTTPQRARTSTASFPTTDRARRACTRGSRDARALVDAGAVRLDGDIAYVRSGDAEHVVRRTGAGARCTCPWFGKHQGSRGPCKHVLAADMLRKAQ